MDHGSFQPRAGHEEIIVRLDGMPVTMAVHGSSLNFIRCQLETLALEQQRVLCSFAVDGLAVHLAQPLPAREFSNVEAESVALDECNLRLLKVAKEQTAYLRECVESSLTLVLINNRRVARELWWNLARQLKEPILTLSLLPDDLCGPANGRASFTQLRKWQLEQVAGIIREVNQTCDAGDTTPLSDMLEQRVLPWLQNLGDMIDLWHETAMAASRLGSKPAAY